MDYCSRLYFCYRNVSAAVLFVLHQVYIYPGNLHGIPNRTLLFNLRVYTGLVPLSMSRDIAILISTGKQPSGMKALIREFDDIVVVSPILGPGSVYLDSAGTGQAITEQF